MRTHPVDKLLEQHCYNSAAHLLQRVRFYVCNVNAIISVLLAQGDVIKTLTSVTSGWQYGENTRTTKLVSNLIICTSEEKYRRKNLTSCNKFVNKLPSHCLSQVVNIFGTTC